MPQRREIWNAKEFGTRKGETARKQRKGNCQRIGSGWADDDRCGI